MNQMQNDIIIIACCDLLWARKKITSILYIFATFTFRARFTCTEYETVMENTPDISV